MLKGFAVFVALVLIFGACSSRATKEATSTAKDVGKAVATAASNVANRIETKTVTLRNIAYDPQRVEIKVGQQVKWTNRDEFPHTATSDNNVFDSGDIGTDKDYSFRFTQAGTYTYHCQIHGKKRMSATIVVN